MVRNLGWATALFGVVALVGFSGVMASGSPFGKVISPAEARDLHGGVAVSCFNVSTYDCPANDYSCTIDGEVYECEATTDLFQFGTANKNGYKEDPDGEYWCCGAGNSACNVYIDSVVKCTTTATTTTIIAE